ncbi:MbcA/ParS/Xre antitoxin family protein [Sphingomonas sp. NIC1]|uniref:MbcA/ParS/Xre antitoxin family protein n=1 Tax=Sphingomonas sp. NIC1 TaxID=1961362 RepID=UPI0007C0F46D|nr:MbcA/ParS/Xre antitoxin family protein [Sphingomonas sp. NIC1]ANC86671.1 hypothetical protein A7E77_07055 [Sphingomonas sp. NIC1]
MSAPFAWETAPLAAVIASWDEMVVRWGLRGDECSALLGEGGCGPIGEVASYGTPLAERRMRLLVVLEPIVASVFDHDMERLRAWLRAPNRSMSGRTPIDVMMRSPEWVRWLINAMGVAA